MLNRRMKTALSLCLSLSLLMLTPAVTFLLPASVQATEDTDSQKIQEKLKAAKQKLSDIKGGLGMVFDAGETYYAFYEELFLPKFNEAITSLDSANSLQEAEEKIEAAEKRVNAAKEAALSEAKDHTVTSIKHSFDESKKYAVTAEAKALLDEEMQGALEAVPGWSVGIWAAVTATYRNSLYLNATYAEGRAQIQKLKDVHQELLSANRTASLVYTDEQLKELTDLVDNYSTAISGISDAADNHHPASHYLPSMQAKAREGIDAMRAIVPSRVVDRKAREEAKVAAADAVKQWLEGLSKPQSESKTKAAAETQLVFEKNGVKVKLENVPNTSAARR